MKQYEEKLKNYMINNNIDAEQLIFEHSCHSVKEAAEAANVGEYALVKNICILDESNNLIVAIIKGNDKVSTSKICDVLNHKTLRMASQEETLAKTGYPCGGVPSFGYSAVYIIDSMVMDMEEIISGGGSSKSLVRISPKELQRANNGVIKTIRK